MCFANPGHKISFSWRAYRAEPGEATPELLCWLPWKELLLQTPAGLVLEKEG